jgi:two-component system KDP operon response regulator KdpE
MHRALVVGDDENADLIEATIRLEWPHAAVHQAGSGATAEVVMRDEHIDLVVLDLDLRSKDGLDALRRIRQSSSVPVVALGVDAPETDWVRVVELGADEYVVKPFGPLEFLARARAVIQPHGAKTGVEEPLAYEDGCVSLDFVAGRASVRGAPVCLTRVEASVLRMLVASRGRIVPYRRLLALLQAPVDDDATGYLRVYVRRLRERIEEDPDSPRYLVSERGVGYRFTCSEPSCP